MLLKTVIRQALKLLPNSSISAFLKQDNYIQLIKFPLLPYGTALYYLEL